MEWLRRKLSNEEGKASGLHKERVRCLSCFKKLVKVAGCPLSKAAKLTKKQDG
jgi:hypothetical protein